MRIKEEDYKKAVCLISSKIYNEEIQPTNDIDILVYATKKQIGKKVVISDRYNNYRCPCCNGNVFRSAHYCSQCGQKLDWRKPQWMTAQLTD